jgi:hypothetical protein
LNFVWKNLQTLQNPRSFEEFLFFQTLKPFVNMFFCCRKKKEISRTPQAKEGKKKTFGTVVSRRSC